jgi:hypothetical protein
MRSDVWKLEFRSEQHRVDLGLGLCYTALLCCATYFGLLLQRMFIM